MARHPFVFGRSLGAASLRARDVLSRAAAAAAVVTLLAAWANAFTTEPGRTASASGFASPAEEGWCLAGPCLDLPEEDLLRRYGAGRASRENPIERCYQARGKSIFVTAFFAGDAPARPVSAILLSGEMTCPESAPARMGPGRTACRGIHLFDPVERLGTVGATKRAPNEKGYPWDGSPPEVTQYDYRCEPERECSVMGSAFVRDRTIIAVAIREPDCGT